MRYTLSYREGAEFFSWRGFQLSHESRIWYRDETYIRDNGEWCYLYRGIDENGDLVDGRRSQTRDMKVSKAFFAQARALHDNVPERVATHGLTTSPQAIEKELSKDVKHEVWPCTENPIERSHGEITVRYYPMLGFGAFEPTQRFCQTVDEVKNFLRTRRYPTESVSLAE